MLPLFKKSHIHSRHIEDLLKRGYVSEEYADENNKRNALRQASILYRIVDNELFRHGTEREYQKYGLRMVVHDDEPEKKAEIIAKCHLDAMGTHLGMNNTIKDVCETYYWQGISAHVKMYLKQCEQCKNRSKFTAEQWLELERKNIDKKKAQAQVSAEAQQELKNLGRIKRPTPPETFFIVNAERKVNLESGTAEPEMMIDSNNIEYVVETLGHSEGLDLEEVCHVLNVPDILPVPERFRSREIETFLRDGTYPSDFTSNMKCGLRGPSAQYKIIEDELYHEGNKVGNKGLRLVIHDDLPALKVKVIVECHIDDDGSHHGLNKTLGRISEKYHWTGMSVDVRKFMMHCKICSEARGRRAQYDAKQYEQEAQEVKSRHMKKMNETEASEPDLLGRASASYDGTNIEPTEDLEQEGHQVIRLIGPNKEVTEITVAVVNQETVTADNDEQNTTIKEGDNSDQFHIVGGETSKGQSLDTKAMTDVVAQIEAAEAAMELAEFKNQKNIKVEGVKTDGEVEHMDDKEDSVQTVVIEGIENEEKNEIEEPHDNNGQSEEAMSIVENNEEVTEVEGEMAQIETDDGVVNVFIIKDGENGQQVQVTEANRDKDDESGDVGRMGSIEVQSFQEVIVQNRFSIMESLTSGTYYNNVIFVPNLSKTRIVENFLKLGIAAEGFPHGKLLELSENFEIVDDVLYRRASRYKGRQIVLHDDNPELKLKFISELHVKRNGVHSSEVITLQNVSFKYFWEEMKWDVHRWYPTCKICVNEDGIERRSNKKILSVEEQKLKLEQKRMENRMSGASALNSRSFRNKVKNQMFDVNFTSPHNKSKVIQLTDLDIRRKGGRIEIKGVRPNARSEHDLSTPGSPKDVNVIRNRNNWNVLYDLLVYATIKQEQLIKEMYFKKGWKYSLKSIEKAQDEDVFDGDENYYLLSMKVTSVQEAAITELFKSMGLAIQSGDALNNINESSQESNKASSDQIRDKVRESGDQKREPVDISEYQTKEPANTEEEIVCCEVEAEKEITKSSSVELQKPLNVSECSPVKPTEGLVRMDLNRFQNEIAAKIGKVDKSKQAISGSISPKQSKSNEIPVTRPGPTIRRINILSKSPAKPATSTSVVGQSQVKEDLIKNTVIHSPPAVAKNTGSNETPDIITENTIPQNTPFVDKTGTKRKNDDTPMSESRRSRREIKKPRRFSPESSPAPKTVMIKIEPLKQKLDEDLIATDDDTEQFETPKLSGTKRKEQSTVVKSKKECGPTTSEVSIVRNTRSSQNVSTETNLVRKQKNQHQGEKVMTEKERKVAEAAQAKISVMSKGRIRVKKVIKEIHPEIIEINPDKTKSTDVVNLTNTKKVQEMNQIIIDSDDSSQAETVDDVTHIIDELDHDDDTIDEDDEIGNDDDEMDDDEIDNIDNDDEMDDDYDDDDDIDDEDDEEEESMKIPLSIILDDAIEKMEPIEVEKGYECSLCGARFPNKSKCLLHGKKITCTTECELCGAIFKIKDQSLFKNHVDKHCKSEKFPCKKCKKTFFSEEHLKVHSRVHNNEVMTKCEPCKEDFYTWYRYAAHMVCKHNECNMFTCDVCNAKFASINFLKSERKFDGTLSYFRCIMCDK